MNKLLRLGFLGCLLMVAVLIGCGGGGGGGDSSVANNGGGIGGTGITSSGTIDGFGSIFVNGVEFETDAATIVLDSNSANESDLRLGMVVTVRGAVDDNGRNGTADNVEFDDDVQGPIAVITVDADGSSKTLTVLGVTVLADQTSTVFDDVSFATLAVDDVIEVSGFFNASGVLVATRIEKKENFTAGVSEIEVKGLVSNLMATEFTLNSFTVDFSAADVSDVPGGQLTDGLSVEVKGTLNGSTITASRIEQEDGVFGDNVDKVSIEGLITDFVDAGNFKIAGQLIDASAAQLQPVGLVLQNGQKVEAEGAVVNGVLQAQSVEARGGEIRLSAAIQSLTVSGTSGDITLGFAVGSLSFSVNAQTELRDETDVFEPLQLDDLRTGHFLEVRGLLNGTDIIATEIRLDEADDEVVQGPVESFVSGSEVTVLGLAYPTPGEIFENAADQFISSADFFSQLFEGRVIKIKDEQAANGVADEVEFED
jgi:hypothetical protein